MKNPNRTIWESASRPLFVRSVWLEKANARIGHRRHFILDYDPRQKRHKNRINLKNHCKKKEFPKLNATSSEISDFNLVDVRTEIKDDNLLIGSAKAKLHPSHYQCNQFQHPPKQQPIKSNRTGRRYSLFTKKQLYELHSRRSSLQDIQSNLSYSESNPNERLAERVLNWLDLAGKSHFLRSPSEINEMPGKEKKSIKLRLPSNSSKNNGQKGQVSIQKSPSSSGNSNNSNNNSSNNQQQQQQQHNQYSNNQRSNNSNNSKKTNSNPAKVITNNNNNNNGNTVPSIERAESVKHITIIFNKEGVPVRFNRPARNIDLCELSNSVSTTRRLAGTLASARLYKNATEGSSGAACKHSNAIGNIANDGSGGGKRMNRADEAGKSSNQKRYAYDVNGYNNNSGHDSKKQLHIFMPSLPKKGLISHDFHPYNPSEAFDDENSGLTSTFNEFCTI